MEAYDVAVIGGGPAGYSAALKAAEAGARVALVEAEKPGGACAHYSCIPTNILLGAAHAYLEARELDVMGVFQAGEHFNLARAAARKDSLVKQLADSILAALRMKQVTLIQGRAAFRDAHALAVTGAGDIWADAVIIASGSRWDVPQIPGLSADRMLTADQVQALREPPVSAVILGGGPADTAFALEYATLLAIAGSEVSVVTPKPRLLPALDAMVADVVKGSFTGAGIKVYENAHWQEMAGETLRVSVAGDEVSLPAAVVIAADPRIPSFETLDLPAAGVHALESIPVDRGCRTNVSHIFAAGDVTGGAMLTNIATHMGEVAGLNAAGGEAHTMLHRAPHHLHTVPEVAWIGLTEEQAAAEGYDVSSGVVDLAYNARAITLGAREGVVKVVASRETGEVLGVHTAGPGAAEMLAVAATVVQAELPVDVLAGLVFWHPSIAEALVEAARRASPAAGV